MFGGSKPDSGDAKPFKKPQIPSLGPNLGSLGFTDLKKDDDEGEVKDIDEAEKPSNAV